MSGPLDTAAPRDGALGPAISTPPPGPRSSRELAELGRLSAPMGPQGNGSPPPLVVYQRGVGSNVYDVDGNRFVDLAAGFGSLLLGHCPPAIVNAAKVQLGTLTQAMGDVHPSDQKLRLMRELVRLHPVPDAQCILGQSGADALTAAIKTAVLATGRSTMVAFRGAYHGLSHGPLSLCGLRTGYRQPFSAQMLPTEFIDYPTDEARMERSLESLRGVLHSARVAGVVFEPIAGRAGCWVPPDGFLSQVIQLAREHGAVSIADEVWTGLGRSGAWLRCDLLGLQPDIVCLGKGLGGGLPISACLASRELMRHWSQPDEVVHTSTFAGAPLAAASAVQLLHELRAGGLVERSRQVGGEWKKQLQEVLARARVEGEVRGAGMMLGVESPGVEPARLQAELLSRGYLTSLGGGRRETLILTPPLNLPQGLFDGFVEALSHSIAACAGGA